ncbi:bifunctional phosphopantothenoylcysteine decarboxylase/phosphopantothenate--cysteine ligase CoaBC [Synechococcus sp. M16CYN]
MAASGSIAAVKTPLLVSALIKAGAVVRCLVTPNAEHLVSPIALASLSRHHCYRDSDQWDPSRSRPLHIELAEWAEVVVVAPMSVSSLSRWCQGSANGLLASVLLAIEVPVLVAIAMNTAMWKHPTVQQNWKTVKAFPGVVTLSPTTGLLACDRLGNGRMADPDLIMLAIASLFSRTEAKALADRDWKGKRLLVTAGPTQESIDQARVLTNRSSGRMGVLLAQAAHLRGASVQLIHGPLSVPEAWLEGLDCSPVRTAAEMQEAIAERQPFVEFIAMVAAVTDFCRIEPSSEKLSKTHLSDFLASGWSQVPDLLANLSRQRPVGQILLGFASLTGEDAILIEKGEIKRRVKGCDLLMVNPIDRLGQGFDDQANGGWLLGESWIREMPITSKLSLAHRLLDEMRQLLVSSAVEPGLVELPVVNI